MKISPPGNYCYLLRVVLVVVLTLLAAAGPVPAQQDLPEIVFVSQTDYPPFEFRGRSGEREGMCIELVRWISTELGFRTRLLDMPFEAAQKAILDGSAEVLTSLFQSPIREKWFDFSHTTWKVPALIFVRQDEDSIRFKEDLSNHCVAMQRGDYAAEFLANNNINPTIIDTRDFTEAIHLLVSKQADALIGDEQIVRHSLVREGLVDSIKPVGEPLYIGQNSFAVAEGNHQILELLNKGIRLAEERGVLQTITRKWLGSSYLPPDPWYFTYRYELKITGSILAVAVLLILLWNIRLRGLVAERTEELRRQQQQLSLALEGADLGTWDWNIQTGEVSFSQRYMEMLGYDQAEFMPPVSSWEKLLHPADKDFVLKTLQAHLDGSTSHYETEHRLRHKNGRWIWIQDRGKVIEWDESGKPSRACGTHMDITERKNSEVQRNADQEFIQRIMETSPAMVTLVDAEGKVSYANQRAIEAFNLDPNEITERSFDDPSWRISTPEGTDFPLDNLPFNIVKQTGKPVHNVVHAITKPDQTQLVLSISAAPLFDEEGQFDGMVAALQDITHLKQVEEQLRASEQRYRSFVENFEGIAFRGSLNFQPEFMHGSVEAITGYTQEQISSGEISWKQVVHPDDFPKLEADTNRLQTQPDTSIEREYRIVRKDGAVRWVHENIKNFSDQAGKPQAVEGAIYDVTALKQAEEERLAIQNSLQETQRLESLGVLAGGIAHDFNNLLQVITGNAELASELLKLNKPIDKYLSEIERASHRAADLCWQMLAYSGRGQFVSERIELSEFVREMQSFLKTSVSKKTAIHLDLGQSLPIVKGDPNQLRQLILNIVVNASEALGDDNGIITIKTSLHEQTENCLVENGYSNPFAQGRYVCLTVSDSGCGMDQEALKRVFEPFYTTKFLGRGLGMSAVMGIVQGHDGAIRINSQPHTGTTVDVFLPVSESTNQSKQEKAFISQAKPTGVKQHGYALVVDDEVAVLELGARLMEHLGFQVLQASDGAEAIEICKKPEPPIRLVLLDLTMPNLDGEETFEAIQQIDPNLPVLISSGFAEDELKKRFQNKPVAGFIKKPYSLQKLRELVEQALA